MSQHVVQIEDPKNRGEREMLNFLTRLPEEEYLVFQELKLDSSFHQKTKGLKQRQPDFVVVGRDTGVLSIEVKDWNLVENQYVWRDQREIKKIDRHGNDVILDNPVHQAQTYRYALEDLLDDLHERPWITSVVAFPRLTWTQFRNQVENKEVFDSPQSRFYLDPDRTIFKDEMSEHIRNPERVLKQVVQVDDRFRRSSGEAVYESKEKLLPSSFRIGDYKQRQEEKQELKMLTEKQCEWVFGLEGDENYLLDVAGSGKTNCLISKALHIVDTADDPSDIHILLTTYSPDLTQNIQQIYNHKLASRDEKRRYNESITIKSLQALKELVLRRAYGLEDLGEERADRSFSEYRNWLQEEALQAIAENHEDWAIFSHIFVDEVQDLDGRDLVLLSLINEGESYFFVGDFGQRIYDREQDFESIQIDPDKAELPKTYQMHRTPKNIAKLATRFVTGDRRLEREFEQKGYTDTPEFPNQSEQLPELEYQTDPVQATTERIKSLLRGGPSGAVYRTDEIMVITTADRVEAQRESLEEEEIDVGGEDGVEVVDFWQAKGLEMEAVFVHGIEDFYRTSQNETLFGGTKEKKKNSRRLRRILYVALTRPLERLTIYYEDQNQSAIDELLTIASDVEKAQSP